MSKKKVEDEVIAEAPKVDDEPVKLESVADQVSGKSKYITNATHNEAAQSVTATFSDGSVAYALGVDAAAYKEFEATFAGEEWKETSKKAFVALGHSE